MKLFDIAPHREVSAKGNSWFAREKIMRGTPLLAEKALFIVTRTPSIRTINRERDNLSPTDREQFDALSAATRTPKCIFDTNSFGFTDTDQGVTKRGLFLEAARINHSCKPNAYWQWNPLLQRLTIHAMAEIPKDEEITISYIPATDHDTRQERQRKLDSWNFQCGCEACEPEMPFGQNSDARRREMYNLQAKIDADNYTDDDMIQRLNNIYKLDDLSRREELLYPSQANICRLIAECYQRSLTGNQTTAASYEVENRRVALEFARKELDLDVIGMGYSSPEVVRTLAFIRGLKG